MTKHILRLITIITMFIVLSASANAGPDIFFIVQAKDSPRKFIDILNSDCTKGVTLYISWERLQPTPDRFDWSRVDEWVQACKQHGKTLNLGVFCGMWAPGWVKERSEKFTFRRQLNPNQSRTGVPKLASAPIPTDTSLLNSIEGLAKGIGSRYNANTTVGYIAVTGPNLTGFTTNITLPLVKDSKRLISKGFSVKKYLYAWKKTIDAYNANIHNHPIILGLGPVLGQSYPNDELCKYISSINVQSGCMVDFLNSKWINSTDNKSLNAIMKTLIDINDIALSGYQMLWWKDKNNILGNLRESIALARDLGADWIELWNQSFDEFSDCCCDSRK